MVLVANWPDGSSRILPRLIGHLLLLGTKFLDRFGNHLWVTKDVTSYYLFNSLAVFKIETADSLALVSCHGWQAQRQAYR